MNESFSGLTTQDLWTRLFENPSIDNYLNKIDENTLPSFPDYIRLLANERGKNPETVIRLSNLENSFGHRLFSGSRNPSRDTVLQLAFGFGLNNDETQQLLKVARVSTLHPKVMRDAVIAYCIYHSMPLVETQQVLYEHGLPLIGGGQKHG